MIQEIFKDIKGYEGLYQISNCGSVFSIKSKRNLKPSKKKTGYFRFELWNKNKGKKFVAHRLVAGAFVPNPENKPQVNHKDSNRGNNYYKNLEWATLSENSRYSKRRKTKKSSIYKGVYPYNSSGRWYASIRLNNKKIILGSYDSEKEAAIAYNTGAKELHKEFALLNIVK